MTSASYHSLRTADFTQGQEHTDAELRMCIRLAEACSGEHYSAATWNEQNQLKFSAVSQLRNLR